MDQLSSLRELTSELDYDCDRYLRTYGFVDPLQYGEEQRWQQIYESFQKRALHGSVLKDMFLNFGEQIADLLDCRLNIHLADRNTEQRRSLLTKRQVLLANVRDSVATVLGLWQTCQRDTSHTFPLKSIAMFPLEFDDIRAVKGIEAEHYTRPWQGNAFHQLKSLESPKEKIKKESGVTFHLRTAKAGFYRKRTLGFQMEEDQPLKVVGYSVIRDSEQTLRFQMGPMIQDKTISVLEVQTMGTDPEYGEVPLNALLGDLIRICREKTSGVLRNGVEDAHRRKGSGDGDFVVC